MVTLVVGDGADPELPDAVSAHLRDRHPVVDVGSLGPRRSDQFRDCPAEDGLPGIHHG